MQYTNVIRQWQKIRVKASDKIYLILVIVKNMLYMLQKQNLHPAVTNDSTLINKLLNIESKRSTCQVES